MNFGNRRFREGNQEAYDAAAWLAAAPGRQLLVPAEMMSTCFAAMKSPQDVGVTGGEHWYLVQGQPRADCVARGDPGRALYYEP